MEILIRKFGDAGICIELPMLSAMPLVKLWKERIVTDLLLMAFSNRAATFLTTDPAPGATGYSFPYQLVLSGGKSYLVNNMPHCDYHDLVTTGESPDMVNGAMTVIAGTPTHQFNNYFPAAEEDMTAIREEIFLCAANGFRVYWLNASRPFADITEAVQDIAAFYQLVAAS